MGVIWDRYEMMQAGDALRWGADTSSPAVQQQLEHVAALEAALRQPLGRPVSLQREVRPYFKPS